MLLNKNYLTFDHFLYISLPFLWSVGRLITLKPIY